MCVLRLRPAVLLLVLSRRPVRWLSRSRRRLVLVLALLNRQRQPRLSMLLVGLMHLKSQHCHDGPGSEPRMAQSEALLVDKV